MADLNYYESGYIEAGFFVYTADAESAQTVSATMEITVSAIRDSSSEMSASFTQTSTISHIEGADLFAFSEAAIAVTVDRIRDNNVSASSVFSIATSIERIQQGSSAEEAFTAITVDNFRVRYDEAAIDAAFSLAADVDVIPGGITVEALGDWTSTSSITAIGDVSKEFISEQTATFEQSADVSRFLKSSVDLSANFILLADIDRNRNLDINLTSTSTVEATALRIYQCTADLSANSTSEVTTNNIIVYNSNIITNAELSATISHIEGADLQAFTNASLSTTPNVIKSTPITLLSEISVVAIPLRIKKSTVIAASSVSLNCSLTTTKTVTSSLSNTSLLSVTAVKKATVSTAFSSSVALVSTVRRLRSTIANLNCYASLTASALDLDIAQATLTATTSLSVTPARYLNRPRNITSLGTGTFTSLAPYRFSTGYRTGSGVGWSYPYDQEMGNAGTVDFWIGIGPSALLGSASAVILKWGNLWTLSVVYNPSPNSQTLYFNGQVVFQLDTFGVGMHYIKCSVTKSGSNYTIHAVDSTHNVYVTVTNAVTYSGSIQFVPNGTYTGLSIDELLVTKGGITNALTTDPYTFSDQSNNLALWHFDDGTDDISVKSNLDPLTITSTATVNVTPGYLSRPTAHLNAVATVSTNSIKKAVASATVSAVSSLNVVNSRTRGSGASLNVTTTFVCNSSRFRSSSSSLSVLANTTTTNLRVRYFATDFSAIASQLSAVVKVGQGLITLESQFHLSADVNLRSGVYGDFHAVTDIVTDNQRIRFSDSSISSQATLTLPEPVKYRSGQAQLTTTATLDCEPRIVTESVVIMLAVGGFNLTTNNLRLRYNSADLNLVTTTTAHPYYTFRSSANLSAQSTLHAVGFNVIFAEAHLSALTSELAVGSVFRIDPYYQIRIKPESRLLKIKPESRLISIESETRGLKIKPESRVLDIEQETRKITIKGYVK